VTDQDLIKSFLDGNQDSFEELVNRYKNLVYSVITRQTRDVEEANDISQEVFIKVYKNLHKYTAEYKFSTWIMRITSNHIIDMHRRKKIETVSIEATEYRADSHADSPETELIRADQAKRINKIVDTLPEKYKIPVILYHHDDLTYQEISEKTDEPLSKVKNRIFRGRKILKALLAEEA